MDQHLLVGWKVQGERTHPDKFLHCTCLNTWTKLSVCLSVRVKSVPDGWWDPKVWPWIRTDTSSRWIIRPAVSSSSNQTGSWWRSSEPEERQTDTLQVRCSTNTDDRVIDEVSYRKTRCSQSDASIRACGWARFTDFIYVSFWMLEGYHMKVMHWNLYELCDFPGQNNSFV